MSPEVQRIALALYEANDTPCSLSCFMLLKAGEFRQLLERKADPRVYVSSLPCLPFPNGDTYFRDNSSTSYLRKFSKLDIGIDRKAVALEAFKAAERTNYLTNRFARQLIAACDNDWAPDEVHAYVPFVQRARGIVSRILGPLPETLTPSFGPGSTFGDRGDESTIADKIQNDSPTCCDSSFHVVSLLWRDDAWWRHFSANSQSQMPHLVRGNRFLTVPKTALTDRPICVEPSLNVYFQKALGGVIRSRLRRVGIDLTKGQDIHRHRLLREADDVATIDLQSASDTIAKDLIRLLLPPEWFSALSSFRSPLTQINGDWHLQEKFSSMGNGFTFELETLVFFSLIRAISPRELVGGVDLHVYGDDIIVPKRFGRAVCGMLRVFGFTPNDAKTFLDGPFKESCGFDIFDGQPVRAAYLYDEPHSPLCYFGICNQLRHLDHRYSGGLDDMLRYRRPWLRALDAVPTNFRSIRGPSSLGDTVIYDHRFDRKIKDGCTLVRALIPRTRRKPVRLFRPTVVLAAVLYGAVTSSLSGDYVSLRGEPVGFRTKWVNVV